MAGSIADLPVSPASAILTGVDTVSIVSAGDTTAVNGYYANIPVLSSTGVGSGAIFTIGVTAGVLTLALVSTAGKGYVLGEDLTFDLSSIGTGTNSVFNVDTVKAAS